MAQSVKFVLEFKSYIDNEWRFVRNYEGTLRDGLKLIEGAQKGLREVFKKKPGVYRLRKVKESKEV